MILNSDGFVFVVVVVVDGEEEVVLKECLKLVVWRDLFC